MSVIVSIPIRVQEALNDSKWVESITKEMRALKKKKKKAKNMMLLPCQVERNMYYKNRCS